MNKILTPLVRLLPPNCRFTLKEKYFDFMLGVDRILGQDDGVLPPLRMMSYVGAQSRTAFLEVGEEFLGYFKTLGGLRPEHSILDMGSGIGRIAIPLAGYLDSRGSYRGFDIAQHGIKWCRSHISARHPNFEFRLADIRDEVYNPSGKTKPAEFRFPYADATFDFAFATSLFTHLLKPVARHYLQETARVLKPGGRALLTFFIMNPASQQSIAEGKSSIPFAHQLDGAWILKPKIPEWAVAFDEREVRDWAARFGLDTEEPIHYGKWSGRPDGMSFQDILILRKRV